MLIKAQPLDKGTEVRGAVHRISHFATDHRFDPDPEAADEHEHKPISGVVCWSQYNWLKLPVMSALKYHMSDHCTGICSFLDDLLEGGEFYLLVSFNATKSCKVGV